MNKPEPELDESESALAPGVRAAPDALRFSFARGSGPGGQNVNKVSTRAELRIAVRDLIGMDHAAADRLRQFAGKRLTREDEIVLHAGEHRSQRDNREACLQRLRDLIAKALIVPRTRRKTKPSRASKERRLAGKRAHSQKKGRRQAPDSE